MIHQDTNLSFNFLALMALAARSPPSALSLTRSIS
jgi:hypothetical protein